MLEPWIIEQIRRREEEERRRQERPRMEIPMRDEREEHWRNGDEAESESDERDKRERERAPERGVMIIDFGVS